MASGGLPKVHPGIPADCKGERDPGLRKGLPRATLPDCSAVRNRRPIVVVVRFATTSDGGRRRKNRPSIGAVVRLGGCNDRATRNPRAAQGRGRAPSETNNTIASPAHGGKCRIRGPVELALGADVQWQAVPLSWRERADELGPDAATVADLWTRLSGRWWRWRWSGTARQLWEREIRARWPGRIGRDRWLSGWRQLAGAGLMVELDGGWMASVGQHEDRIARFVKENEALPGSGQELVKEERVREIFASSLPTNQTPGAASETGSKNTTRDPSDDVKANIGVDQETAREHTRVATRGPVVGEKSEGEHDSVVTAKRGLIRTGDQASDGGRKDHGTATSEPPDEPGEPDPAWWTGDTAKGPHRAQWASRFGLLRATLERELTRAQGPGARRQQRRREQFGAAHYFAVLGGGSYDALQCASNWAPDDVWNRALGKLQQRREPPPNPLRYMTAVIRGLLDEREAERRRNARQPNGTGHKLIRTTDRQVSPPPAGSPLALALAAVGKTVHPPGCTYGDATTTRVHPQGGRGRDHGA